MNLTLTDQIIILAFLVLSLLIGISVARQAGKSSKNFFLSGRDMPWWLLGISMVATTFSADTPNLVTDIVRAKGVAGNWAWWAFLLTGMLTVFVYARLWRRSGVMTDLEFYELRYSGNKAAILRGFRAIYLGVIFNVLIMASVTLAAIKIAGIMLGISPIQTVIIASVITVAYSALGGLKGVIITDFFQFILAMVGAIGACIIIVNLPEVGGLSSLLSSEAVKPKLSLIPDFNDSSIYVPIFLVPLLVQWWSVWYPGAEPGGGGYIAQRMFAAKTEKHAVGATLLFNIAHYALRPWPWILIALASLVVFPELSDIKTAFPAIDDKILKNDLAYPAMLTYLPSGFLGLVLASLIAAFMSTLSTHLNWGASYITHDFYKRFINQNVTEKKLVSIGRWSTVFLMIAAALLALAMSNALEAFEILLQIGAGTGLLFLLRWFWWRINAWSEISAMIASFIIALFLEIIWQKAGWPELAAHIKLLIGVAGTTAVWVTVTLLTKPTHHDTLLNFYRTIKPHALGWSRFLKQHHQEKLPSGSFTNELAAMLCACLVVIGVLFSTGFTIYGLYIKAVFFGSIAIISTIALILIWKKLKFE